MVRNRTTAERSAEQREARSRSLALLAIFLAASSAAAGAAQRPLPTIRVGIAASDLDAGTGVWEQRVAPDAIAGLSIRVLTKVPSNTHTLSGAVQTVRFVAVTTYLRTNGVSTVNGKVDRSLMICCQARNAAATWWSSDMPGDFSVENGKLHFRQTSQFVVALDLVYDEAIAGWRGRYESPYFKGDVALQRPRATASGAPLGTWLESSSLIIDLSKSEKRQFDCVHIALGEDGQLVLGADGHALRIGSTTATEPPFDESYGELLNDTLTTRRGDEWIFYYGNGMWREKVTGKVSVDGNEFTGYVTDHEGNGVYDSRNLPQPFLWTRMSGEECASP